MRRFLPFAVVAAMAVGCPLEAQEPWDVSFRMSAGAFSGARAAGLGQETLLGLSLEGAYPLLRRGDLVLEGGFRLLPKARAEAADLAVEERTDGWVAGAAYRHRFGPGRLEGLYVQAGLAASRLESRRTTVDLLDGARLREKGSGTLGIGPVLGAGFRFNDTLSLQATVRRLKAEDPKGLDKTATVVELGLGIHL